jgi:phenylalanine-4-hydroxylase
MTYAIPNENERPAFDDAEASRLMRLKMEIFLFQKLALITESLDHLASVAVKNDFSGHTMKQIELLLKNRSEVIAEIQKKLKEFSSGYKKGLPTPT